METGGTGRDTGVADRRRGVGEGAVGTGVHALVHRKVVAESGHCLAAAADGGTRTEGADRWTGGADVVECVGAVGAGGHALSIAFEVGPAAAGAIESRRSRTGQTVRVAALALMILISSVEDGVLSFRAAY